MRTSESGIKSYGSESINGKTGISDPDTDPGYRSFCKPEMVRKVVNFNQYSTVRYEVADGIKSSIFFLLSGIV